jgi:ligand-binding sensor domain-containing protein
LAGSNKGSACFSIALLLMLALAETSSVRAERLPIKIYTAADGLANNRVIRIVRDSQGFLWFCTAEGLSRFDGYGFTTYGLEQGLPAQTINDLIETREGVYWVATEGGGVCRFNPSANSSMTAKQVQAQTESRFTAYHLDEGQANEVYRLFEDRRGRIWAGTMGGLFRLDEPSNDGSQFRRVDLKLSSQEDRLTKVWAFAEDGEGAIWIGHSFGLNRHLPGGHMVHYSIQPVQEADYVWSLLIDREGRVWIGHESGMIVLKPEFRGVN